MSSRSADLARVCLTGPQQIGGKCCCSCRDSWAGSRCSERYPHLLAGVCLCNCVCVCVCVSVCLCLCVCVHVHMRTLSILRMEAGSRLECFSSALSSISQQHRSVWEGSTEGLVRWKGAGEFMDPARPPYPPNCTHTSRQSDTFLIDSASGESIFGAQRCC